MESGSPKTSPNQIITISIIEDNRYVRTGWQAVLQNVPNFEVVGLFESCEAAFAVEEIGISDVVIMDIGLPGMSGIEGVKVIAEKYADTAIIMCTVYDDDEKIFEALCSGAIGYLLKKIQPQELIHAIQDAAAGGSPMTPNSARKVITSFQGTTDTSRRKEDQLSEREKEILHLLSQGKSYAAIGKELFLSVDGVRYHIRHFYEKLQVHSRAEAVAKGLQNHIIQPPR